MNSPFQRDETFLIDVRRGLASRKFGIWWLGQSGFLVVNEGRAVVFDPYLSDSLTRKYDGTDKPHVRITERVVAPAPLGGLGVIDAITCSHNHTDHCDAETLKPLLSLNPQAKLICPAANRDFIIARLGAEFAPRLLGMNDGAAATAGGIEFHGIPAAHNALERDGAGQCLFMGWVAHWDGMVFYHSGDTLRHDALVKELKKFKVDVAFLPINGDRPERRVAGNLDGVQAAQLAHDIGARLVVPSHYDLFEFNTASPAEFVAECRRLGQAYHILRNGEGLEDPEWGTRGAE